MPRVSIVTLPRTRKQVELSSVSAAGAKAGGCVFWVMTAGLVEAPEEARSARLRAPRPTHYLINACSRHQVRKIFNARSWRAFCFFGNRTKSQKAEFFLNFHRSSPFLRVKTKNAYCDRKRINNQKHESNKKPVYRII